MRLPRVAVFVALVASTVPPLVLAACGDGGSSSHATTTSESLPDAQPLETSAATLPTLLASGLDEPRGIALVGDTLYVAEYGAGRILAVPRAGGAPRLVAAGRRGPHRIATDGEVLVVTERDGGDVVRLGLDGQIKVLASGVNLPTEVRIRDGWAYFVTAGGGDGGPGAVWRASLATGSATRLVGDVDRPSGLAIGARHLYFSADRVGAVAGTVFAAATEDAEIEVDASLDGGDNDASRSGDKPWAVLATAHPVDAVELDERKGLLYLGTRKGAGAGAGHGWVDRADVGDASSTMLAIAPGGCVDRIQLEGGFVYYKTCSTLMRVAAGGGPHEDLAINTSAGDFVVADATLYWTDAVAGRVYALRVTAR